MASGDSLPLVVRLWREYVLRQICPGEEATNPEDGFGRTTVRPSNAHANTAGRDPIHLRGSGARTGCDRDSCDPCIVPIRPGFSNSTTPRPSNIPSAAENAAAAFSLPADVVKYYLDAGAGLGAADYGPRAPSGSEVFATATTLFASDVFEGMGVSRTWGRSARLGTHPSGNPSAVLSPVAV
ncbi:hypothetical protein B0J15DRAFT_404993 [Fusarium solani]|uniref:Uncharacterized protein n=1 Tax=Fusarium solani TaxID=169388 RepID=A0A9P9GJ23_FUSSL|nr:uncharacterized protein B0J15DRAFT_404993 [Fusarium solani]KAH7240469.1 hypothetical protein B0J15DRAFT_404993 [Fusarium solani]